MTWKYRVAKYMGSSWLDGSIDNMSFGLFVSGSVIVVNVTDLQTCGGVLRESDAQWRD